MTNLILIIWVLIWALRPLFQAYQVLRIMRVKLSRKNKP